MRPLACILAAMIVSPAVALFAQPDDAVPNLELVPVHDPPIGETRTVSPGEVMYTQTVVGIQKVAKLTRDMKASRKHHLNRHIPLRGFIDEDTGLELWCWRRADGVNSYTFMSTENWTCFCDRDGDGVIDSYRFRGKKVKDPTPFEISTVEVADLEQLEDWNLEWTAPRLVYLGRTASALRIMVRLYDEDDDFAGEQELTYELDGAASNIDVVGQTFEISIDSGGAATVTRREPNQD